MLLLSIDWTNLHELLRSLYDLSLYTHLTLPTKA